MENYDDDLKPAKGIVLGIAIGIVIWIAIVAIVTIR